jgi:hypothetical protein
MSVRIRLEAADPAELDAHEAALRAVLTIPAAGSRDYPNRRRGGDSEPAGRRYLDSMGTRAGSAGAGQAGGEPSPLAVAEDAKRRRDLAGEIGALTRADADLQRQPWAPLQPGDVVLSYLPASADMPAYGTTYLAVDEDTDLAGNAMLREVSHTRPAFDDADPDACPPEDDTVPLPDRFDLVPFYDLWFEHGPGELVVVRGGAVVHGTPAAATAVR